MDIERLSLIGRMAVRPHTGSKSKEKKNGPLSKVSFSELLGGVGEGETAIPEALGQLPDLDGSETLESLLDAVHEIGEELKRDPVLGPLTEYKNSIRRFFRYALDNGLAAEEKVGIRNPQNWKQKKYILIRVVDQKLQSLVVHVLKGQADQLEILRRVDEINGLLIDIAG